MSATWRWLLLLAVTLAGCLVEVEKLYLEGSADARDGNASQPPDSGTDATRDAPVEVAVDSAADATSSPDKGCVPESCNGVDDDCDGTIDNGACEPGCTGKQDKGGEAFAFCTTGLSHADAAAACKKMTMGLASILNATENSWILATAQALSMTEDAWLGGTDSAAEGTWVWPDGSTFWIVQDGGTGPGYAAWGSGEPNDENGEDCLELILNAADGPVGDWNDEGCWRTQSFICRE